MPKTVINDYCTNVIVNKSEIQDIRILYDKRLKLSEWYAKYKPDIIINGGLFESSGKPIETFKSNGNLISKSNWCNYGFGIKNSIELNFGDYNDSYKDFIIGFPNLISNNKININFDVGASLSAKQPRSVFSETDNEFILTTIDGRRSDKPGKTIKETATYMSYFNVKNSINLDGGGSTRMMYNGKTINNPTEDRAVSNVIAIWLKKNNTDNIQTNEVSKVKICLDYGHNNSGYDTGASYNNYREQDITYDIGKIVKTELENNGIQVIETRPIKTNNLGTDLNSSLKTRTDIANNNKVDYFISLHCNANTNTTAYGTEVYIQATGGQAEKLAKSVDTSLCENAKTYNRGVKVSNLYVTRKTNMPAILVEMAFISNLNDCENMIKNPKLFAKGIAKGVCKFLGLTYKEIADNVNISNNTNSVNKYSYDNTVEHMIRLGITDKANMEHWEKVLAGKEAINKDEVRIIFDRFIAKLYS